MKKRSSCQQIQKRTVKTRRTHESVTIGMDLGDRTSRYCMLSSEGEILREDQVPTTKAGMMETFGALGRSRIAIEVGTHSPWVSRLLGSLGHEIIVANPRQVKLITAAWAKFTKRAAHVGAASTAATLPRRAALKWLLAAAALVIGAASNAQGASMASALTGLPQYGVTLSGDPHTPTIVNSTDRRIVMYVIQFYKAGPNGPVERNLSVRNGIPHLQMGTANEPTTVPAHGSKTVFPEFVEENMGKAVKAELEGVLFEDGEFVGPDRRGLFETLKATVEGERQLYQSVVNGKSDAANWKKLQDLKDWDQTGPQPGVANPTEAQDRACGHLKVRAREILLKRDMGGDDAAHTLATRYLTYLPKKGVWRK